MLSHLRVLDLTDKKGLFCGKILADLGADVIKIERPGGDPARNIGPFHKNIPHPERSLFWFALNTNKRGITLNIETFDGQEIFKRLITISDFVIESFSPGYMESLGLGYATLSKKNPRIIMTAISPFGQEGPYRDYKVSDVVAMAMGGRLYLMGDPDRPPVRITYPQSYQIAGAEAAAASLIAHYFREITGEGQYVDVSMQKCIVWNTQDPTLFWDLTKKNVRRSGSLRRRPDTGVASAFVWQCKNGYVCFSITGGPLGSRSLKGLVEYMDNEGLADSFLEGKDWDTFDWAKLSQDEVNCVVERFQKFFLKHTKQELYYEGIKRRITIYPVSSIDEVLEDPQLKARDFWVDVEHPELGATITYPGPLFKLSEYTLNKWCRAPLIGEHNIEVYEKELGLTREELCILKQAAVI